MHIFLITILIVSNLCYISNYYSSKSFFDDDFLTSHCEERFIRNNQTVRWFAANEMVVISKPACMDDDGRLITRKCHNGKWFPLEMPVCNNYKFIEKCPIGFLKILNNCLHISKPEELTYSCPYGGKKFYDYTKIILSGNFWMPRKVNFTFNNTTPTYMPRYEYEFDVTENIRKECFIFDQNIISHTNCSSLNHHICSYKIENFPENAENSLPQLELKLDKKHNRILLNVYSGNIFSREIYCSTDSTRNKLTSEVKIKLIFNSFEKERSNLLENLLVYEISIKNDFLGEYRCEAYNPNINEISVSNVIIASKKNQGHEYALRIVLASNQSYSEYRAEIDRIYDYLEKVNFKDIFKGVDLVYRIRDIYFNHDGRTVEAILHLSTLQSTELTVEYDKLVQSLKLLPKEIDVKYFRSSEACIPDSSNNLTWELTSIKNFAVPRELCLDSNGFPIQRECLGDFGTGAYWSDPINSCSNYTINARTKQLHNLSTTEVTEIDIEIIKNITSSRDLTPLDIFLVANTLSNLKYQDSEYEVVDNIVETIDNIQDNDRPVLKESQLYLNTTDIILDSINNFLRSNNKSLLIRKDRLIVHITRPFLSKTNGLAVYNFVEDKFDNIEITDIKINQTFDDLNQNSLELDYYIPVEILEKIVLEEDYDRHNLTVITTVFYNDNLFNPVESNENSSRIKGHVIGVTIPDYGLFLEEPLQILFKNHNHGNNIPACAFWQYGLNSYDRKGNWSSIGGNFLGNTNGFSQCAYTHLTYFAQLIMSQTLTQFAAAQNLDYNSNLHDDILDIISIVGCILSVIGILGIFITAACFDRSRQTVIKKIWLHLAITILIESTAVLLANTDYFPDNSFECIVMGMCLHYAVLSKFSWMCVSAVIQYQKLVIVFAVLPTRVVLKSSFFGWLLPLLPVLMLAYSAPDSYKGGQQKFCYPEGIGLYYGVFVPVVLTVIVNLIMFIFIMFNVLFSNVQGRQLKRSQKLRIKLGVLLFFMFGLSWVFGILAEFLAPSYVQLVFIYLFCLTATLEGLILFIFYVILDRDTRELWNIRWKGVSRLLKIDNQTSSAAL